MAKIDAAKIWSLNYRLLMSVITSVANDVAKLGLEAKELFVLAEIDGRKGMTKGLALFSDAFEARLGHLSATEQAQFGSLLEKLS